MSTPTHLLPENCYVCGHAAHADTTAQGGHKFWSNADAKAEFSTPVVPTEPAPKFIVCPACGGEGSHGPGFTWTSDEVAQEDPDDFADFQRSIRRGDHDITCEFCDGNRVVLAVDSDGYSASERYQDQLDYEAEVRAEQRYFGNY